MKLRSEPITGAQNGLVPWEVATTSSYTACEPEHKREGKDLSSSVRVFHTKGS